MIYLDTEFEPDGTPICLSYCLDDGPPELVWASDEGALAALRVYLTAAAKRQEPAVFHAALADLEPLRKMGIDLEAMGCRLDDTMVRAFHHTGEPKGLKDLAERHAGIAGPSFPEMVNEHHLVLLRAHLAGIIAAHPAETVERVGKRGQPLKPKLKRQAPEKAATRALKTLNPWESWCNFCAKNPSVDRGPEPSWRHVPTETFVAYAKRDAHMTRAVYRALAAPQTEAFKMDLSRLYSLSRMQAVGLQMNRPAHGLLLAWLEAEIGTLTKALKVATNDPDFNPAAPEDIARFVYGVEKEADGTWTLDPAKARLKPVGKPLATGRPSTGKKNLLIGLLDEPQEAYLIGLLLQFREYAKLLSTYVRPLPEFLDAADVLHPRFNVVNVPSGRLAAYDPNVLAFPARTEVGRRVRSLFTARPGTYFVSADFSQIELRMGAEIAKDPQLLALFTAGADVHTKNAAFFFGKKEADITKPERTVSKSIGSFGVYYGASPARLWFESLAAGVTAYSQDDYARLVADWFKLYPVTYAYIKAVATTTRAAGYSDDMWGRRRLLPAAQLIGWGWPISAMRAEAERQAFNHQVQGAAAGLITRAQIRMHNWLKTVRAAGYHAEMLLQIHDELVLELDKRLDPTDAENLVREIMLADQPRFTVKLDVSFSQGETWGDLK